MKVNWAHGRIQCFKLQPPLGEQFDALDVPALETDAKLETFSSNFFPLHAGHLISEISEYFSTSDSNSRPHSRHENSKRGISSSKYYPRALSPIRYPNQTTILTFVSKFVRHGTTKIIHYRDWHRFPVAIANPAVAVDTYNAEPSFSEQPLMRHISHPMAHEKEIVGASGRSPVSDFRLTSAGDRQVVPTILLFSKQIPSRRMKEILENPNIVPRKPAIPTVRKTDLKPAITGCMHSDFYSLMDGKHCDIFRPRTTTDVCLLFDHYAFFPKVPFIDLPGQ
jgi:hypothetical protein